MAQAAKDKAEKAANKPMTMQEQINAQLAKMKAKAEAQAAAGLLKAPAEKPIARAVSPRV